MPSKGGCEKMFFSLSPLAGATPSGRIFSGSVNFQLMNCHNKPSIRLRHNERGTLFPPGRQFCRGSIVAAAAAELPLASRSTALVSILIASLLMERAAATSTKPKNTPTRTPRRKTSTTLTQNEQISTMTEKAAMGFSDAAIDEGRL